MERHEPGPTTVATLLHGFEPAQPFVTGRSRQALEHLVSAFEEARPVAILNSGWAAGSRQVINSFLSQLPKSVAVAQVTGSSASEAAGMRNLIRSIGFDPKELPLTELQLIFINFLAFQRKRRRRTVLVMEDSGVNGEWVCNYLGRLVELETREKFGLTVVLVRQTRFDEYVDEPLLDPISYKVGKHISLTPFTPLETREFVRWRIQARESANIGRILGLDAITLIHELCDGLRRFVQLRPFAAVIFDSLVVFIFPTVLLVDFDQLDQRHPTKSVIRMRDEFSQCRISCVPPRVFQPRNSIMHKFPIPRGQVSHREECRFP